MLKARQKKNLKQKVKGMSKDVDELEEQIDKLKQNIDADKAQVYAEQGSALGLLDQDVVVKKAKIANALDNAYTGFQSELTQVEREDIEIHRTQMAIEKEKELGAAEAEIDEEALKSHKQREIEEQKDELRKKIDTQADPSEKERMLATMAGLESDLQR